MAIYRKTSKQFIEDHPICEGCNSALSKEVHHRIGRQGARLNDQKYWLAICPACHKKCHDFPAWAFERGYSLDRLAK